MTFIVSDSECFTSQKFLSQHFIKTWDLYDWNKVDEKQKIQLKDKQDYDVFEYM